MRAVDLIKAKRDGQTLSTEQVAWLIDAYVRGEVGDDQMAAFAMAVFFKGMDSTELAALVEAMMGSGEVIDLGHVPGIKVDKHSTGGVGDKISLALAPLVAACGVVVPMMSGRGLGHTGGTLDKLSAIPGFSSDIEPADYVKQVEDLGMALIGQTKTMVPADKRLYALRDVTSTVESIPLIAASIMSKKLAEGIDGLVLDVKVGSGAFMKTTDDARKLALTMVGIGERMGKNVRALITDMSQVLGEAVGNANEAWEAFETLRGDGPQDVHDLTVELGAEMLILGGVAQDLNDGRARIGAAMKDGSGLEMMRRCVERQGGDPKALENQKLLPSAPHRAVVPALAAGTVTQFDTEAIGRAGMVLGAGRARSTDDIDLGVGLLMKVRRGDQIEAGQSLAIVDYRDEGKFDQAKAILQKAVTVGDVAVDLPLVLERHPESKS